MCCSLFFPSVVKKQNVCISKYRNLEKAYSTVKIKLLQILHEQEIDIISGTC